MKSFKQGNIELINTDCMGYMKTLPDNAFDLVITSPPYNMNLRVNAKGSGYCSRQVVKEISTKYENYSDNLPMDEYFEFLSGFISEACRVSDLVFLNIQMITGNKPALFNAIGKHSDKLKEVIVWDKVVAQPSIADKTMNSAFEFIFVFGGNPIARQFKSANFDKGTCSNIWRIKPSRRSADNHGAGFPKALPETIIRQFAKPDARILDPFLGTGTTAIAAYNAGMGFVGLEIDQSYFEFACERFSRETSQVDMFGGVA